MKPEHPVYRTVAELLDPALLSQISGNAITHAEWSIVSPAHSTSGSTFHRVSTNHGTGPIFLLKHMSVDSNWIMRATSDVLCREVHIWQSGILDRLPPSVGHPYLAAVLDDGQYTLLMWDVTSNLIDEGSLQQANNEMILHSMADIHAKFWEYEHEETTTRALCTVPQLFACFSPDVDTLKQSRRMPWPWNRLFRWLGEDMAEEVHSLLLNPQRLATVLKPFPRTLVHGDLRIENLALESRPVTRLTIFDWQLAAIAPAAVDLAWYIGSSASLLLATKEDCIAVYQSRLRKALTDRFHEESWNAQLALAFLGGFLRIGSSLVARIETEDERKLSEQSVAELEWWTDKIRRGLTVLRDREAEAS